MKKVTFNQELNKIHTQYTWTYAHQTARQGYWEEAARDRVRFSRRIEEAAKYINPILDITHRNKIYNKMNKTVE